MKQGWEPWRSNYNIWKTKSHNLLVCTERQLGWTNVTLSVHMSFGKYLSTAKSTWLLNYMIFHTNSKQSGFQLQNVWTTNKWMQSSQKQNPKLNCLMKRLVRGSAIKLQRMHNKLKVAMVLLIIQHRDQSTILLQGLVSKAGIKFHLQTKWHCIS